MVNNVYSLFHQPWDPKLEKKPKNIKSEQNSIFQFSGYTIWLF